VIVIGKFAVYVALILAAAAAAIALYAGHKKEDGEELGSNAYYITMVVFGAVTVASLILLYAFIAKDYSFAYVAENSSADMSLFYRIAAFWAGQEGSLLFWAWLLTGAAAIIAYQKANDYEVLVTNALGVLNVISLFFLFVLVTPGGDAFKVALAGLPPGGAGINPLLLHWAMVIHPPTLFIGYAGLAIPFAFALGALITGDVSRRWLIISDRWAVGAWLFLSIGIFLGALWAYVVLGWGGFWGWDPVENSSFVPWLTATAMLHSFTVWKRRNGFKFWAVSMAALSFFLTLLATYITRSGIITDSAHTFQGDPYFKLVFDIFMVLTLVVTAVLLWWRREELYSPVLAGGDSGEETLFSREFIYYLNNVFMLLAAGIITYGTLAPAITTWLGLPKVTYSADFYNGIAAPLSILYVTAMGLCPVLSWRKTEPAKFWRLLMWPAGAAAVGAVPIVMYFSSKPVGTMGMIVSVFAAAAAVQLFVRGALARAKSKGISPLAALGDLFMKNRSQTGGYIVHLGVAITVIGIIGTIMFGTEDLVSIGKTKGSVATAPIAGIRLEVVDLKKKTFPKKEQPPSTYVIERQELTLRLTEGGKPAGTIKPVLKGYQRSIERAEAEGHFGEGYNPEIDVKVEPFRDVFVIYQGESTDKRTLSLQVKINPLITWVWIGSMILVLGTAWAMWPTAAKPETPAKKGRGAPRARAA
jgi:cytochrome c-type biogenesis protein CcmF